jgi:hypothetical protein
VFLSPLSLAEYVDSLRDHPPVAEKSGTSPFALAPLWDCLEVKPADVPQLASELKRTMFRARWRERLSHLLALWYECPYPFAS